MLDVGIQRCAQYEDSIGRTGEKARFWTLWVGGRWWLIASGSTQGLILSGARSGLCSELCSSTQCSRVTFRARGQAEAMARNIFPNSAGRQRSKHSPWHLKTIFAEAPKSLQTRSTPQILLLLLGIHIPRPSSHCPIIYQPDNSNSQRSTQGELQLPECSCAQAGTRKNRCSFKLRACFFHWFSRCRSHWGSVTVIGWQLLLL